MSSGQQFKKYFCSKCQERLPYLHCQAKCHFDKNGKMMFFCGNMNMDVSPYILKFKFFKNTCSTMGAWIQDGPFYLKSEMIYLPKQVCLIIIHRNTTHILDIPCCNKYQQQRYHNENTKICLFIQCMYVDVLFLLTKVILIVFGGVLPNSHTLPNSTKMIGHNATRQHNLNA